MKRNLLLLLIFVPTVIGLLSFVLQEVQRESLESKESKSPEIQNALRKIAENLDQATFTPIRVGWAFDYGFKSGWLLNKYEYIRSLLTFKSFQAMLEYPIYLSECHTNDELNLNSKYSFGHYNPKFVTLLHKSTLAVLREREFIKKTKPILEKYDILEFLKKHKDIYDITQKNPDEFERIKLNYIKGIQDETWPEGAYRNELPELLNSSDYWNWSETSYHFWIRRDIDSTKDIWVGIINDVLKAYDY
ncbi:MAG: hypothetical protein IPO21_19745 [Bacteroidales bacterium]|nr:hypothetical protein [Bacteroidales bacterium]